MYVARRLQGSRGARAWIVLAVVNILPVIFGSSYVFWPSDTVREHNGTEGLVDVNRYLWGAFVIASAVAMLVVALRGLRERQTWAWYAAWSDIVFFVIVAVIEPDYFFPVIVGIVVAATLLYARPGLVAGAATAEAG